jgi:predicted DNA-binding transcriptional regulator AlpA
MADSSAADNLLVMRDVAAGTRMSPSFLWQQKAAGLLPFVQIGRSIRFRESDVTAWIDAHAHAALPTPSTRPVNRRAAGGQRLRSAAGLRSAREALKGIARRD